MEKRKKSPSPWRLVHVDDLPRPSSEELQVARRRWVNQQVRFSLGADRWSRGMVSSITETGEVNIAVWRGGSWVHGRVIRLEYAMRVLRLVK